MDVDAVESGEVGEEQESLRSQKIKKRLRLKKPKTRKLVETKYARNEKNFWPQQVQYYFYFIMLGNGTDLFPFMVCFLLKLSGGLFLIMYIVGCLLIGMPMIYMEIFLGRYTTLTNSQMYRMVPVFFGFGVMVLVMNLFYLPLKVVQTSQFLINCMKLIIESKMYRACPPDADSTCYDPRRGVQPKGHFCNHSDYECDQVGKVKYITEYIHWRMFEGSDQSQYPIWQLMISLSVTWILICVILIFGMRVIGVLIKWFNIAMWVIFSLIFFIAIIDSGSIEGLELMVNMDSTKFDLYPCLVTMFFSVSKLGLLVPTGYMTASAYAKFPKRHRVGAEALLLVVLNVFLSIYFLAGFFAIAGAYAKAINFQIDHVMTSYSGLYLALIPGFLTHMDCPVSFMVVYLFCFWMWQLVNVAVVIHQVVLNLYDYLPQLGYFPNYVVMSVCILSSIMSGVGCSQVFVTLNKILAANYIVLCVVVHMFLESCCVFYCYGVNRLCDDIHFMTGSRPMRFWQFLWYILPVISLVSFVVIVAKITSLHDMLSTLAHFSLSNIYLIAGAMLPVSTVVLACFASFLFVVFVFRTFSASLLKPQFFWGPPRRDVRIARKAFSPRTSVRSQPPRRKLQRFKRRSIRQLHEKDLAEGEKRGHIFFDIDFFRNITMGKGKIISANINNPISVNY